MRKNIRLIILSMVICLGSTVFICSQENPAGIITISGNAYPAYPRLLDQIPDIPSPCFTEDGLEVVIVCTTDKRYALIPVTVENGEPWITGGKRGKGLQLLVDEKDFPTLARTGLHSEFELAQTRTITGRSIARITEEGRPGHMSGAGFMAADEDIISMIQGDNRLVRGLGLTHPQVVRPLFHIFNIIQYHGQSLSLGEQRLESIDYVLYNGFKIRLLGWQSGHGYQDSIFEDEILGFYQIEIGRELTPSERGLLTELYPNLSPGEMAALCQSLSYIHTGEMAFFYIMRYGFYEGHTSYRTDPVVIARMFGLRSLGDIEEAFPGALPDILNTHHTRNLSTRQGGSE